MEKQNGLQERILDWVEKDRFSLTTALIYITTLGIIRSFLDSLVKDHGWYNMYEMAHYVFVAYPEFLLGALVIFILAKAPMRKVWNVVLLGFWLLLIPPIVDYFILGDYGAEVGTQYGYLAMEQLMPTLRVMLLNPFQRPGDIASTGQMVMFFSMIIGSIAYVALSNGLPGQIGNVIRNGLDEARGLGKTLVKVVLTYYGLFITYWIIGALQFIIRIGSESIVLFNILSHPVEKQYYDFFYTYDYSTGEVFPEGYVARMGLLENLAFNQSNLFFGFVFLAIGVLLLLLCLYLAYKEALHKMLKNIRILDTSIVLSAAFVGIASLHIVDGDFSQGWAIDPFYILHAQYVLFCLAGLFFLAQFSFLIDDIGANKRDEARQNPLSNGSIPEYHYKQLAISYALAGTFIALILGTWTLILALAWVAFSYTSSLYQSKYIGSLRAASIGFLAFLFGYYTPGSWIAFIAEHADGEWIYVSNETLTRSPAFTSQTIVLLLTVVLGFVLISLFSKKRTFFYAELNSDLDLSKTVLLFVPLLFLLPLASYFSLFTAITVISLAFGVLVCYKIIDDEIVIKFGFLLLFVLFSILLI